MRKMAYKLEKEWMEGEYMMLKSAELLFSRMDGNKIDRQTVNQRFGGFLRLAKLSEKSKYLNL